MQSAGIVAELDDATPQNCALVEETTTAAAWLADQALGLSHAVGVFKLAERLAA